MRYTKEKLIEFIQFEMIKRLENNGFIRGEGNDIFSYSKKYSWGWDNCSLSSVLFLETHLEFGINISRRYNCIEDLWIDFRELINYCATEESNLFLPTIIVNHNNASEEIKKKDYYDGSLRFEISEDGIGKIPEAIEFIIGKILEKLNLFLDLKELDKVVNSKFPFDEELHSVLYWEGLICKRIIIAKSTNNPNYENLCDFIRNSFEWYIENGKIEGQEYFLNYPVVFEKVYERLKNLRFS